MDLPDMSGFEVLRSLRVSKVRTPTLILSGLAGIEDKVKGFGFGADDYMTKPFHKDELVARIHAVVRRCKGHAQSMVQSGDLIINLDSKMVEINGARVRLTGKEYQILELLSLRKGMTLTKEMFLNHLYGGMDEPEVKIIDVFMCKLRKKLTNASGGKNYIETVWNRGYVLRHPAEEAMKDISLTLRVSASRDAKPTNSPVPTYSFGERGGLAHLAPFCEGAGFAGY
jgi:two-component system, cell cycle response regulator CtrA